MIIHRVALGESVYAIARKYSVSVLKLMGDNGLADGRLAVGEELLILKPTREAPALLGDSVSKLALRFGVRKNSLYCLNPWIAGAEYLRPGQMLAVKASHPAYGTANALGIARKETQKTRFKAALPFLTYVSLMEYRLSTGGLERCASLGEMRELARRHSRTVLLGIELDASVLGGECNLDSLIRKMTELAKEGGDDGIYLKLTLGVCDRELITKFMLALRRHLLGKDLILVSEAEGGEASEAIEISDGATVRIEDISFGGDTAQGLIDFASRNEALKCFVMPSYRVGGAEKLSISGALRIARRMNKELCYRKENGTLTFDYGQFKGGRGERICAEIPSLQKVSDELRLAKELGYGGFAFDIEDTPISYFCIFNALFSRADYISLTEEQG